LYQHLPLQDLPKFTQTWIYGLKIYHLATLAWLRNFKGCLRRSGFTYYITKSFSQSRLSIEILDLEQVCWHRSCKYFLGKEHLAKNQLISALEKVICIKWTIFLRPSKPLFTSQNRVETSWKKFARLFQNASSRSKISMRLRLGTSMLPLFARWGGGEGIKGAKAGKPWHERAHIVPAFGWWCQSGFTQCHVPVVLSTSLFPLFWLGHSSSRFPNTPIRNHVTWSRFLSEEFPNCTSDKRGRFKRKEIYLCYKKRPSFCSFWCAIRKLVAYKTGPRSSLLRSGLPDFSWYNIPKRGKNYQNDYKITIKYTKWS
jgi:hypothetical protein